MLTADYLASLALEAWRASGARTLPRLETLVTRYGESYFGSCGAWTVATADLVSSARAVALTRVRPWEV